ncbi:MAG: Wzz/FepE/Etk N-terminal domain-containing protein [Pseudomonadota bacterium]
MTEDNKHNAATRPPSEPQIDLAQMIALLRRSAWIIALSMLVGLALAWAASLRIAPQYEADVTLRATENLSSGSGQLGGLAGSLGGFASLTGLSLGGGSDARERSMAILRSRALGLALIEEQSLIPLLFEESWDATTESWTVPDSEVPSALDAWERLSEEVRAIEEERRSGNITVTFRWSDPVRAAKWANALVDLANRRTRELAIESATQSNAFLEQELGRTSNANIKGSIYSLIEKNIANITLANVSSDYAFEIIDPALASDPDDVVWPDLKIMLPAGAFAGLVFGLCVVLVRGRSNVIIH